MTEYKFEKCRVRIYGKEPEGMKEATERFLKKVERCRKQREKEKTKS